VRPDEVVQPFDGYADSYSDALRQGLAVSGESQFFFAEKRINWFANRARALGCRPQSILDFGSGQGSSTRLLLDALGGSEAVGMDTSAALIATAKQSNTDARIKYLQIAASTRAEESFDCAYTNGVFHHIAIAERADACRFVFNSLRPGGLFALWENNPWNPGTRYVMRRIPFDRDAVTLTIPEAVGLASGVGFEVLDVDSLFFFPRQLRALRGLEPLLSRTRLGAQYMVFCRKPSARLTRVA